MSGAKNGMTMGCRRLETAAPGATSPRRSAADVARALMSVDRREPGCGSGAATAGATTGDGTATEASAGRGTRPAARLGTEAPQPDLEPTWDLCPWPAAPPDERGA